MPKASKQKRESWARQDRLAVKRASSPPAVPFDLLLRQIGEKVTVAIIKLHNVQVELGELRRENAELRHELRRVVETMRVLCEDPEARHHAEAIMRDYFANRPEVRPR